MMKVKTNISKLKESRVKAGHTAASLAKEIKVSRQTMYNIENGLNNPSPSTAKAISDIINVPFDELFTIEEGE